MTWTFPSDNKITIVIIDNKIAVISSLYSENRDFREPYKKNGGFENWFNNVLKYVQESKYSIN